MILARAPVLQRIKIGCFARISLLAISSYTFRLFARRGKMMSATRAAFDVFRGSLHPRAPREGVIRNVDETKLMTEDEGLAEWIDGQGRPANPAGAAPLLTADDCAKCSLWVVRLEDVVHAPERCDFGKSLASGVIKHTNLTGGAPAYSGGEIIALDENTIVINGYSGRYGPRTRSELDAVARAFADSGYGVWYMGWDDDANRPAPFLGVLPQWVS